MSNQKFKTGDVVKLKSGGPNMTVSRYLQPIDILAAVYRTEPRDLGEGLIVVCTYFQGNKIVTPRYHQDLLDIVHSGIQ